jgi:lipopolysaccharide heptosyltransferase II
MSKSNAKRSLKNSYLKARQALLTIGGRLPWRGSTMAATAPVEPRSILFIRIDRIGDMVLSTPAFRALKRAFPAARLTVLASRSNASLLQHDPCVDHVIVWNRNRSGSGSFGFLRGAARLARNSYDVVIDPMTGHDLYTALIAFFSRAPVRVGFPGYGREVFFNRLVSLDDTRHLTELVLETARALGAGPSNTLPRLPLLAVEHLGAQNWLHARGLGKRPMVVLHLGANYPSQRWPPDYYADLAYRVMEDLPCDVVAIEGPGERGLIDSFNAHANRSVVVFESRDLRQAAAMIAQADAIVCNNSGPLHMAAALGIPTLSFMGPTEKCRWMPLGPRHIVLRQDRLDCIGCNCRTCWRGDHAFMRMITPQTAARHLLSLLHKDQITSSSSLGGCHV